MKRILILLMTIIACASVSFAQASGNVGYSQSGGNAKAEQNERTKRLLPQTELPPTQTSMFVEASVLMNVKADEFVAVFGLSQECATVPECNQKMDATVNEFTSALKRLGINGDDLYVDFAAQNKIYGYELATNIAKEKLVGFELKKNVAVHYKDKSLLDKLVIAAAQSRIFDLIKVDYIVKDTTGVQNRILEEAAKIIKQKAARYENLLGIKLQQPGQVYAERPSIYFPTEMYDSYAAYESEDISSDYYRQRYTVQGARKSRTFFFNGLNADGFDFVINPVMIEPVVQFTLYLKVRYEIEQPKK
ncbi:MAG TPA: SIMPL domain-containing protein [Blastocatellia bacterium]|nr:SIMPL domain-containing protein [Blastocatellia bacterium]